MELAGAKSEFLRLLDGTKPSDVSEFLAWVNDSFAVAKDADSEACSALTEARATLTAMASELRARLPASAVAQSETIVWPQDAPDFPEASTVHVDAFLYSEDEVGALLPSPPPPSPSRRPSSGPRTPPTSPRPPPSTSTPSSTPRTRWGSSPFPASAVAQSETIVWPQDALDFPEASTVHVDAFLYSEDEVDLLAEQGVLARNFCKSCGSKDVAPLNFISHSLSQPALEYVFTSLVPGGELVGKSVVDVGSRLGPVLYAGCLYAPQAKFVGIEMNSELASLTAECLVRWGMGERAAVLCQDLRSSQAIVAAADLLVLNNVFQFFLPKKDQAECWSALRAWVKPGTLLLTNPSVPDATKGLHVPDVGDWLEELESESKAAKFAGTDADLFEELSALHLYRVK